MDKTENDTKAKPVRLKSLPLRLHHNAYVTADQELTRHFYEDVIGLPLIATWVEASNFEGRQSTFCHTFFGIGDGGALAFFNFADEKDAAMFKPHEQPPTVHVALAVDEAGAREIKERLKAAGIEALEIDHGFCRSFYVTDPNGLRLEFTLDPPNVAEIDKLQRETAHEALARWTRGERIVNNGMRHEDVGSNGAAASSASNA
jgi:glyoxylase I family protein